MNYLESVFKSKIDTSFSDVEIKEIKRARVDFLIILLVAYLWDQNIDNQDYETKKLLLEYIEKPTIGDLFDCCIHLAGSKKELKKLKKQVEKIKQTYLKLRNSKIGHGYSFADDSKQYNEGIDKCYDDISNIVSLTIGEKEEYDFIYIHDYSENTYNGLSFVFNSVNKHKIQIDLIELDQGGLYLYKYSTADYIKISPFINYSIQEDNFFIFSKIQDGLKGSISTVGIIKTNPNHTVYDKSFCSPIVIEDGNKVISKTGCVKNKFQLNFDQYIEIKSIRNKLEDFLRANSSVAITIWGHGGTGKTALTQYICEQYWQSKDFSYIVFLSAKDRKFDYKLHKIVDQKQMVSKYQDVIKSLSELLFNEESYSEDIISRILSFKEQDKKILIVLDDFETFDNETQESLKILIEKMDVNLFKVIITTRMDIRVGGVQIKTNDLNEEEIKDFLLHLINSNTFGFTKENQVNLKKEIEINQKYLKEIRDITWGRPIFIYQFLNFLQSRPKLISALSLFKKFSNEKEKIQFLYGRIYNNLKEPAKDIFVVVGKLLQNRGELSEEIDKVKYLCNHLSENSFYEGFNELVNMRLVEKLLDESVFRVYGNSKEIQELMLEEFDKRSSDFKTNIEDSMILKSKKSETLGETLVKDLEYKISKFDTEENISELFKKIINSEFKIDIKFNAISLFIDYKASITDKKTSVDELEKYENIISNDSEVSTRYHLFALSLISKISLSERGSYIDRFGAKIKSLNNLDINLRMSLFVQESTFWINSRNLTKNEIDSDSKNQKLKKEAGNFQRLFKEGSNIFSDIKASTELISEDIIKNFSYSFIEICRRTQQVDAAYSIYEYIKKIFDSDLDEKFESIISKIKRDQSNYSIDTNIKNISRKIKNSDYNTSCKIILEELSKYPEGTNEHNKIYEFYIRHLLKNKDKNEVKKTFVNKLSTNFLLNHLDLLVILEKYMYYDILIEVIYRLIDDEKIKISITNYINSYAQFLLKEWGKFNQGHAKYTKQEIYDGYNELSKLIKDYYKYHDSFENMKDEKFYYGAIKMVHYARPRNNKIGNRILLEFKNKFADSEDINFEIYEKWFS